MSLYEPSIAFSPLAQLHLYRFVCTYMCLGWVVELYALISSTPSPDLWRSRDIIGDPSTGTVSTVGSYPQPLTFTARRATTILTTTMSTAAKTTFYTTCILSVLTVVGVHYIQRAEKAVCTLPINPSLPPLSTSSIIPPSTIYPLPHFPPQPPAPANTPQAMHAGVLRDIERQRIKKERQLDFEVQAALERELRKSQDVVDTSSQAPEGPPLGMGGFGGGGGVPDLSPRSSAGGR